MKKCLMALGMIFCLNCFGQEYKFDSFYEYKLNDTFVSFYMINSLDSNYLFCGSSSNNKITGFIYDFKNKEYHNFNVSNIENAIKFEYNNSYKIKGVFNPQLKNVYLETKIIIKDSLKEIVKILKYKQRKKKKYLSECEFTYNIENIGFVFHDSALGFFFHDSFNNRPIETLANRLPTTISYNDYYNGYNKKFTLTKRQKISTTLNISKEEIKYIE